jgi:uncharacterized FlaG/YvyC family protein
MEISSVSPPGQAFPAVPDVQIANWLAENRELIRTVKEIDAAELFGQDSELTFARDQETCRPVVRVINRQTHQVLMQLPPDYVLRLARALDGVAGPADTVRQAGE